MTEPQPTPPAAGLSAAARYWDQNLDPQNLERGEAAEPAPRMSLADEIAFARTPDLAAARQWLCSGTIDGADGAGGAPAWLLDLGAGLGANSFALAQDQDGLTVLAVDTSLARLRTLRERARAAGLEGRIRLVVAAAETLPFAADSVPALYTKSVLIHTELARAAGELARVLTPGGRAALVEPQPGNPLAWAYRRWLAPKAWRSITRYFDPAAQALFLRAPGLRAPRLPVRPFYLLSFLAFGFHYGWPRPGLFRWSLRLLGGLDRFLFRLAPPLRRWAWFGVIRLEKRLPRPR